MARRIGRHGQWHTPGQVIGHLPCEDGETDLMVEYVVILAGLKMRCCVTAYGCFVLAGRHGLRTEPS
jgi:hypothetical protein